MKKRFTSFLLSITLIFSFVSLPVSAAHIKEEISPPLSEVKLKLDEKDGQLFISGNLSEKVIPGELAANKFIEENKVIIGVDNPKNELKIKLIKKEENGGTLVRYFQCINGLRVLGNELNIYFNKNGIIQSVNGRIEKNKNITTLGDGNITKSQAIEIAKKQVTYKSLRNIQAGEKVILNKDGKNYEVYKINIFYMEPDIGNYDIYVEGHSGKVLQKESNLRYDGPVTGTGVDVLGKTKSLNLYLSASSYEMRDLTKSSASEIRTYDMQNGTSTGYLVSDYTNSFIGENYKASVSAHYNAGIVIDFYKNLFNRNSIDGESMAVNSYTHYNSNYNNAFWDGAEMVYGDGDGETFTYLSGDLDIVGHEMTHGVISNTANLYYHNQSGALNESIADVFGVLIETYDKYNVANGGSWIFDPSDWVIGDDIYTPYISGDALRSLRDPTLYNQPDNFSNYLYLEDTENGDYGGVHKNCGITNKAAYLIASEIGMEKLVNIYYRAITTYMDMYTSFSGAKNCLELAAGDLYGINFPEVLAITNSFLSVGITDEVKVSGINLDKTSADLKVGGSINLIATISPENASNKRINWTSSNTSIATVDSSGKVTGAADGQAAITAVTEDGGYSASCNVTVTAPKLGISIDKKTAVAGDSIKFTIDTKDSGVSDIRSIYIYYIKPITKGSKTINLKLTQEGIYEGSLALTDMDESGIWKIKYIFIYDSSYKYTYFYNSATSSSVPNQDFSGCDFDLTGTTGDITPPEIKSLTVDKTSVLAGGKVKITMNATDNGGSGIKEIFVYYIKPITKEGKGIFLKMLEEGVYEGILESTDIDELGTWKIDFIGLKDNCDNNVFIYNSNISSSNPKQDFSNCDFELKENTIKPLSQSYITKNETWTSKVIDGDLYIGPNAVLTINGPVTVTGNVYVLGALRSYGSLTVNKAIYAKKFLWGYGILYNGTVIFAGGSNYAGSLIASDEPVNIPSVIYEANNKTLAVVNNKLNITGAFIPVADLYIDGIKVDYYDNGTFDFNEDVTDKDSISVETVDVFGNKKTTVYYLVKVNEPIQTYVNGVSLDVTQTSLIVNNTFKLNASINPADASINDVIWTSSNENIVKVDNTGLISAVGPGNAAVTLTTVDGRYTASCNVTVIKPVTGIILDKTSAVIKIGDILYLIATVSPADASNKNVTWSSSNPLAATVSSTGAVTGISKGDAVITAVTVDGGYAASCSVTVTKPVTGVILDKTKAGIKIGDTLNLMATVSPADASNKNVTWSSSNLLAASVSSTGTVTGVSKGEAIITAVTVDGGYTASCSVTVIKPVTGVILDKTNASIKAGYKLNLMATVSPEDASNKNVTWSSSNPAAATVSSIGTVTAVAEGQAIITAVTVDGGYTASCTVNVLSNEKPIISGASDKNIKIGDSFDVKAGITAADKEDGDLSSKIVVSGSVDILKTGEYTITYTVTDSDGNEVSKSITISVIARNIQVISLVGSSRYDTAVKLSQSQFAASDTVIIVNGTAMADGLGATPLAAYMKAPLLLIETKSLPAVTINEIKRLKAKKVIIVGGTGVVSENVKSQLQALGLSVERLSGSSRYGTSLTVAKYIDKNCYDVSRIVIANGYGEADALSIASVAGRDGMPIILAEKDNITTDIYNWLSSENIETAYIIGGTGVVSDNVLNKIDAITAANVRNNRLGGKNRFETNALVIDRFYGSVIDKTYIAKGYILIDALAAGSVAAINGAPVVLSGTDLDISQKAVLGKKYGNTIIRTGGGISDTAVNSLKSCLQ